MTARDLDGLILTFSVRRLSVAVAKGRRLFADCLSPPPLAQVIWVFLYHLTGISHFTSKVTVKITLIGKMVTLFNLPSFDFGISHHSHVRPPFWDNKMWGRT